MRVMLVCAGGLGHLFPLIPLARAAVAAGDEVVFATTGDGVGRVEGFGFAAVQVPDGDPAQLAAAWSQLPERDVNTFVVAEIFLRIQGAAALPAQLSLIDSFRPDLVISSELPALVAAEASGVASAYVGITALDLDDLDLTRVVAALDDLRIAAGLPILGRLPFPDRAMYLSPLPPVLWADQAHLPEGWLWYRHEDAEGPVDLVPGRRADQRARVYATIGSVAGGNEFGRSVAQSMIKALGRLDAEVVFTGTVGELSEADRVPANVTVAKYLSQSEAMNCDVAVVHGGSGTTVAALARGLAMVVVPMFADQMHNADRLVEAGIGRRVDPERIPQQLTSAVEAVLTDPRYRTNAERVAGTIAARPTPAEALEILRERTGAAREPGKRQA